MTAVLENTILPIDIRKTDAVAGFAEKVFIEVAVSKILRKILRMEDRGILHLTAVHYISQPIMGGFIAPLGKPRPTKDSTYTQALIDGAKGVPAVWFAQYVVNTSLRGLHVPGLSMKEAFITAAAKALSRPLMKYITPKLGSTIDRQYQVADFIVQRQADRSRLKMKE